MRLTSAISSIFSTRPPLSDPGPRAGIQSGHGTGDRLASHDTYQPQGEPGQGHVSRKSLQVDVGGSRTGRSPSVSPDRGSVPTSPYSVPQIAPMPSSKLCPVCKTTDLMGPGDNFNTCTQCHCKVCNQCGFNPNPHLTEVRSSLERTVPFLSLGRFLFFLMVAQPRQYQKWIQNSKYHCVFKWKEQQKM